MAINSVVLNMSVLMKDIVNPHLQLFIGQARRRLLKGRYNEFVNIHLMVLRQVLA